MNMFEQFHGSITEVLQTRHFQRDEHDFDERLIMGNEHHRLHKYEEIIDGNHIFRALHGKVHYVFAIDKGHRLIMLRAFHNFKEYKKFLDDKEAVLHLISGV